MLTGSYLVQLRFWSSARQSIVMQLHAGSDQVPAGHSRVRQVHVTYRLGDEVVLGRDSRQERREILVLSVRTSNAMVLNYKKLLCQWLNDCYTAWAKPEDGVVKVFALHESSSEWPPEWHYGGIEPAKGRRGLALRFI